jgi:hypothetical protein
MKNDTRSKLETLLDNYEKKRLEEEIKQEQIQTAREIFLENFQELREKVMRPAMEEIGEILEQKGHQYNIEEQEYSIDRKGFTQEAHIEFNVFPTGKTEKFHFDNHPSVSFATDIGSLNVEAHGSYMMPEIRGEKDHLGTYTLSEITGELVEKEILAILVKAFNR